MDYFQAVFLGIVQGITEFLPVSSSGHLAVMQRMFGLPESSNLFEVMVHCGTLIAIIAVFRRDIGKLIKSFYIFIRGKATRDDNERCRTCIYILLAMAPTGLIGLLVEKRYSRMSGSVLFVGLMFFVTGVALLMTKLAASESDASRTAPKRITLGLALLIGISQGLATIPGISRSAVTISAGLISGVSRSESVRFSFLLAVPAIAGAALLKIISLARGAEQTQYLWQMAAGAIVACVVGYACLLFLIRIIQKGKFWYFSFYAFAAGVFSVIVSVF